MAIYKNKASQKLAVYAYDSTDASAKTGDAANITAQISKDGGVTAATNDVNPTELDAADAPGVYLFDMTQAETNADLVVVAAVSGTANILLETLMIYTEPEQRVVASVAADVVTDSASRTASKADVSGLATSGALATVDTEVGQIKTVTDNLPDSGALTTIGTDAARLTAVRAAVLTDWIDAGRLDLLLDAITAVGPTKVEMDTAHGLLGTEAKQDTAQNDLDTITGTAGVELGTGQAAAWASALEASAGTIKEGTAKAGTLSTTEMSTTMTEENDVFNGRILIFKADTATAALRLQATDITDYVNTNGVLTFTALTTAPSATDTFIIV